MNSLLQDSPLALGIPERSGSTLITPQLTVYSVVPIPRDAFKQSFFHKPSLVHLVCHVRDTCTVINSNVLCERLTCITTYSSTVTEYIFGRDIGQQMKS